MAYEFTRKTDNVDDVMAADVNELQAAIETLSQLKGVCNGRLTLESGVPISTNNQTDKTTLFFTPYNGNSIDLYNGINWIRHTFTQRTLAIGALTASKPHDIFIYNNSGTLTLSATEWTNATTRATALTRQDGVYVKSGATNYRYLGTIYIDSGQKCQDTNGARFVWNNQNRVRRLLFATDTTNSWTYTTATYRPFNNSSVDGVGRVSLVCGLEEDILSMTCKAAFSNSSAGVLVCVGIGFNTSGGGRQDGGLTHAAHSYAANGIVHVDSYLNKTIPAGCYYISTMEYSAATGTTTWYGDNASVAFASGLSGVWTC